MAFWERKKRGDLFFFFIAEKWGNMTKCEHLLSEQVICGKKSYQWICVSKKFSSVSFYGKWKKKIN